MVYRFLDLQPERLRIKDDAVTTNFELLKRQSRTIILEDQKRPHGEANFA